MLWQKATGVLFLAKYKFSNGKVNLVAIPFKKYTDAAKCYKNEAKKDSIFSAKLTQLVSLEKQKDEKGNVVFEFTPTQGGMNLDFLKTYATELFAKLKIGVEVVGGGNMEENDLEEVTVAVGETLSNKKSELIVAKQAKRVARAAKIQEKVSALEKVIGKLDKEKVSANLAILEEALSNLKVEAEADGNIDSTEQQELDRLAALIADKKKLVEQLPEAPKSEQLLKDIESAKTIAATIKDIMNQLSL